MSSRSFDFVINRGRIFQPRLPIPMNTHFLFVPKTLATVALAMTGMLAVPAPSEAKPKKKKSKSHSSHSSRHYRNDDRDHDHDHDHDRRTYFYSRPRSSFVLTLGTGYAGRGYYYGPANS